MKVNIGPILNKGKSSRVIDIQIDRYDVQNVDNTISLILVPLLKRYKDVATTGTPIVQDEDLPENLRTTEKNDNTIAPEETFENDDTYFRQKRWNWILDEIIWTFEQYMNDSRFDVIQSSENYYRVKNGRMLFAKYFDDMWI